MLEFCTGSVSVDQVPVRSSFFCIPTPPIWVLSNNFGQLSSLLVRANLISPRSIPLPCELEFWPFHSSRITDRVVFQSGWFLTLSSLPLPEFRQHFPFFLFDNRLLLIVYACFGPRLLTTIAHLSGLMLALRCSLLHRCRGISSSSTAHFPIRLVVISVPHLAAATLRLSGLTWAPVVDHRCL